MKKYILPIIIFISVTIISVFLYANVIPTGIIRSIIPLTVLAIIIVYKIRTNQFSKADAIFLGVGFIIILVIVLRIISRNYF